MKKVSHKAPKVKTIHKDDKTPHSPTEEELDTLDTRIALIQALIPIGLDAVAEELQQEVTRLSGDRYSRKAQQNPNRRWAVNKGLCIFLIKKCLSLYRGYVMWRRMRKSLWGLSSSSGSQTYG